MRSWSLSKVWSLFPIVTALVVVACSSSSGGSTGGGGGGGGGSGDDCTSLCTAGQAGKCTTITGDCSKFCSAIEVVEPEAGCTSQYNAYESCLGSGSTVCTNSCDDQDSALQGCIETYCAAHTSDTNCQTVAASF